MKCQPQNLEFRNNPESYVHDFVWFDSLRPSQQSSVTELSRDGSSWVEQVLSKDKCVLLKDKRQWRWRGSNPQPFGLGSSTLTLHSLTFMIKHRELSVALMIYHAETIGFPLDVASLFHWLLIYHFAWLLSYQGK